MSGLGMYGPVSGGSLGAGYEIEGAGEDNTATEEKLSIKPQAAGHRQRFYANSKNL